MAPKPGSILDRLSPRHTQSPLLPLYQGPAREESEYDLDELPSPRSDGALLSYDSPRTPTPTMTSTKSRGPVSAYPHSTVGYYARGSEVMFDGPPPPIAASMLALPGSEGRPRHQHHSSSTNGRSPPSSGLHGLTSTLFDRRARDRPIQPTDNVWRGLQRRESALRSEVQRYLDMQELGLLSGGDTTNLEVGSHTDRDALSETAGSDTPTGTFYSAAESRSRILDSAFPPVRSTPRGDVIPVRQPKTKRQPGIGAARKGLATSMASLARLKEEEDRHLTAALLERKNVLARVSRLAAKRESIAEELRVLEEDDEEPLGRGLGELTARHDHLDQGIRELEEKLVSMRNEKRNVASRIYELRNKREAGLSGYRGALGQVDSELHGLLRHPPVQPLDEELLRHATFQPPGEVGSSGLSTGGVEFLHLIPDRRTSDMMRGWLQAEMSVLEAREVDLRKERDALRRGLDLWEKVVESVTTYESNLRRATKSSSPASALDGSRLDDVMKKQLTKMRDVISGLKSYASEAEDKGWNLLICAIGAELEAFQHAEQMLRSNIPDEHDEAVPSVFNPTNGTGTEGEAGRSAPAEVTGGTRVLHEAQSNNCPSSSPALSRSDSDNEVPPEFLMEVQREDSID